MLLNIIEESSGTQWNLKSLSATTAQNCAPHPPLRLGLDILESVTSRSCGGQIR